MTLPNLDNNALLVHKLNIECGVPCGQQNAYAIHDRVRKLANSHLGVAIEQALKPLDQPDNEGLIFLRRLEIAFEFDLALSSSQIARRWAEILKDHLVKKLSQAGSRENIVYFSSRRIYLGRFLGDLAKGLAWQTWYYREFDGLKALPLSAALRTAILDDPAEGFHALLTLDDFDLSEVVNSLTTSDMATVFDGLASGSTGTAEASSIVHLLVDLLANSPRIHQFLGDDTRRAALYLCLNLCRQTGPVCLDSLKPIAHAFVLLLHLAEHEHLGKLDRIISTVRTGELSNLVRETSSDHVLKLQALFALDKKDLETVLGVLTHSVSGRSLHERVSAEDRFTFFGNVFLLLPQINNLPIAEASVTWPQIKDDNKVAILRWLTLALCQGARQFRRALRDPVIRDLCGIHPATTEIQALDWLDNISLNQREDFFRVFCRWALETPTTPIKMFEMVRDEMALTIYQETRKGGWLYLSPTSDQIVPGFGDILDEKNICTELIEDQVKTLKADVRK